MEDVFEASGRKRKGSLRKSVLLGVERLHRRSSSASNNDTKKSPTKISPLKQPKSPSKSASEVVEAKPITEKQSIAQDGSSRQSTFDSEAGLGSSFASPTGTYASTSEDDGLTIPSGSINHALLHPLPLRTISPSPSPPSSESSVVATDASTPPRRRSPTNKAKSPLADPLAQSAAVPPTQQEWDYSDTEWWGWVILIVTWIVFVVGMGSCFGVWSWAWDVGETPYAPPELEDDPTLPIVGYYPALFVLTAVVSWMWVTVAWVGLKYFKHAKLQGEDS